MTIFRKHVKGMAARRTEGNPPRFTAGDRQEHFVLNVIYALRLVSLVVVVVVNGFLRPR